MGSEEEAAETGLTGPEICLVETEHQEGGSDAIERDLEFELPDGLKDLLRRLSGNVTSDDDLVSAIPYLGKEEYGDFFRHHSTCARAGEVRVKVLNALGNCQTLDEIDLCYLAEEYNLTLPEWEAFLSPLQSNPALERMKEIKISSLRSAETEASIGGCMTNILAKAQNLERLCFFPIPFTGGSPASHGISAVASGLQASPHLSLHAVIIGTGLTNYLDSAAVQQVARLIYATHIHMLELRGFAKLDEVAKKALVVALRSCKQLEKLTIYECGEGMGDVLAEAYKGASSKTPLSELYIDTISYRVDGLADALVKAVSPNIRKIHLQVDVSFSLTLSIAEWQNISRFLSDVKSPDSVCTLISFEVKLCEIPNFDIISLTRGLDAFWKASQYSTLVSFSATIDLSWSFFSLPYYMPLFSNFTRVTIIFGDLVEGNRLEFLQIFKHFLTTINSSKLLQTLVLETIGYYPYLYQDLFQSLHCNTSIRKLDLSNNSKLDEDAFKSVMELLQINLTLVEIDVTRTPWVEDGKSAIIEEALRRNMKQAAYLSVLRDANLDFQEAKAGRIFLCGSPLAGKTQLKLTMMETEEQESKSESWASRTWCAVRGKLRLGRTKGIEVEMLRDNDEMKVSVWDLAGQFIFRALQDLLFPRSRQPCIFVFVFNPFEKRGRKTVLRENPTDAFENELKKWLRFIVSNVQVTGHILPQVLVVITHEDKMKKHGSDFFLENTVERVIELRKEFTDVLDLCPDAERNGVYHINAKHKEGVQKITAHLLQWMEGLLRRKTPAAPRACSELISHFSKGLAKVKRSPVWSVDEFYDECSTNDRLKHFSSSDEQGKRVLHAVALYLHDMGAIFLIPGADGKSGGESGDHILVVVDPNWLTQNFLGEIVSLGHRFEVKKESQDSRSGIRSSDGFVSEDQLHSFLTRILGRGQRDGREMERKHAVQLLLDLDLCHELNSKKRKYFMPMLVGEKDRMDATVTKKIHNLSWGFDNGNDADYFGYRVQCRDRQRTSFTAAFFPRYQIHLRKRLGESINMVDENFIFSRNFVEIRSHSCHIFVELDEHGEDHVDIMVRFLKSRNRDTAIDFVQKHILDELVEFCASPRGCPGVQLVVSILRTDCVRELVPRESRTANVATVLRDELKRNFQEDLEDQIDHGNEDPVTNYDHSWPKLETPGGTLQLPGTFEPACILLPFKDVKDVLTAVQRHRNQLRESLNNLRQVSAKLNHVAGVELDLTVAESATKPLPPSGLRGSFRKMDGSSLSEEAQRILHAVEGLKKIMSARFRDLQNELRDFKGILHEIRSTMTEVSSKVDATIGYMRSEDDHRTPRRPYFTVNDVSLLQKLRAGVVFSTPVRLHLMCESRNKPHFVPNQPGLELNLEKSGKHHQWMLTMSVISLKMIWVMLNVGIQITSGLATMVPDISNLATGVSIGLSMFALEQMKLSDSEALLEDEAVSEAWCRLRETLAPKLTADECSKRFNLYRVKYKSSEDPVAWVCDSCMKDGRRNRLLD